MKAFSPAGPAVKAFFGYGAKTFGNPRGDTSGSGGPDGHILPPPPTPPPTPPHVLNLVIAQDYIDTGTPSTGSAILLSQLLTTAGLLAQWESGNYNTLNISGGGIPARGYWVLAGNSAPSNANGGYDGFRIDVSPPVPVTINADLSLIRIYGSGGCGSLNTFGTGGGFAIKMNSAAGFASSINLNLTMIKGALIGRLMGGGGGGGGNFSGEAGCGASGWFPGLYSGATPNAGGVYDPNAPGGTNNPNVLGSAGIGAGTGNGGGLGQDGFAGTGFAGGLGGKAVGRTDLNGPPGVTTIINGNDPAYIRGIIQ